MYYYSPPTPPTHTHHTHTHTHTFAMQITLDYSLFTTSHPKCWTKSTMLEVWYYSLAEFDCAVELLDFVDWDSLLPHDEVNTYWSAWKNYLKSCRFAVFLTVW